METAYLALDGFFGLIWAALFFTQPERRREMLLVSATLATMAFVAPILARDYFAAIYLFPITAHLGLEDLLFAFFAAGVAAVLYDSLFRIRLAQTGHTPRMRTFVVMYSSGFALFLLLTLGLGYSGILVGSAILFGAGLVQVFMRPDLLKEAVLSGILMTILLALSYEAFLIPLYPGVMQAYWQSAYFIWGVPYQEFVWALAWGVFVGPVYKFSFGLSTDSR